MLSLMPLVCHTASLARLMENPQICADAYRTPSMQMFEVHGAPVGGQTVSICRFGQSSSLAR